MISSPPYSTSWLLHASNSNTPLAGTGQASAAAWTAGPHTAHQLSQRAGGPSLTQLCRCPEASLGPARYQPCPLPNPARQLAPARPVANFDKHSNPLSGCSRCQSSWFGISLLLGRHGAGSPPCAPSIPLPSHFSNALPSTPTPPFFSLTPSLPTPAPAIRRSGAAHAAHVP